MPTRCGKHRSPWRLVGRPHGERAVANAHCQASLKRLLFPNDIGLKIAPVRGRGPARMCERRSITSVTASLAE
jgi:hypothetical protein